MKLKALQDVEYMALCYLVEICRKHNLRLFLRGGSVLGAVKYNDFVPWDDDIDVALPRSDYEKLLEIVPERINNNLLFISYQKSTNAHCYFPRIILDDQSRENMGFPKYIERCLVLIDILPLDGMPDNSIVLMFHIAKAYFYRFLAAIWTIESDGTVSMHGKRKDAILQFFNKIKIHKLYKQDFVYEKLDKLYSHYAYGETRLCGMLASSKFKKEIVPFSWWGNGVNGVFRGSSILLPVNFDMYLKRLFGDDYATTTPPESMRTKSHIIWKE